jgi:hypothetical protein
VQPGDHEAARREALLDLVKLRRPLPEAIARLGGFPWDSDRELVTLTRADLVAAAEAYLAGGLTSKDLESWAEHLEVREDVDLQRDRDALVGEAIFLLANPVINYDLTPEFVRGLRARLSGRA